MKENTLQTSLHQALRDTRILSLLNSYGPKGLGYYWLVLSAVKNTPYGKATIKELFLMVEKNRVPYTFLKKFIVNDELFEIDSEGYISMKDLDLDNTVDTEHIDIY